MKLKYYGHSFFEIETTKKILIDPFITDNPFCDLKPMSIQTDIICVTHSHLDHLGQALEVARFSKAVIVSVHEIAEYARKNHCKSEGMNIGGTITIDGIKINMVQALHSSGMGVPCGFVIESEGKAIYHAGDTGLFGDMKIIGEFFDIDVALLPVGDRYTMGIKSAAKAVEFLKCKKVVPMHYNTWDIIKADISEFKKLVKSAEVVPLKPGEVLEI